MNDKNVVELRWMEGTMHTARMTEEMYDALMGVRSTFAPKMWLDTMIGMIDSSKDENAGYFGMVSEPLSTDVVRIGPMAEIRTWADAFDRVELRLKAPILMRDLPLSDMENVLISSLLGKLYEMKDRYRGILEVME